MKKQRILGLLLLVLLLTGVVLTAMSSRDYAKNLAFYKLDVIIEDPDNQKLITKTEIQSTAAQFLAAQKDSSALSLNAFLLETSVLDLPYVEQAQVYWNMDSSLVIEARSKSVVAMAYSNEKRAYISSKNEVIPQPKKHWLDLPIITGSSDSTELAEAGTLLTRMTEIMPEGSIAQIDLDGEELKIVPRAYPHVARAHADERLERELKKLAAYYTAHSEEELKEITRIDLRYKNQVVTTTR